MRNAGFLGRINRTACDGQRCVRGDLGCSASIIERKHLAVKIQRSDKIHSGSVEGNIAGQHDLFAFTRIRHSDGFFESLSIGNGIYFDYAGIVLEVDRADRTEYFHVTSFHGQRFN